MLSNTPAILRITAGIFSILMKSFQTIYLAIFLFSILFMGNCQNSAQDEPGQLLLTTVKEFQISTEAAQHLGRVIQRIPASPADDLLALTNTDSPLHIIIVDYDGNLIDIVGAEGRGPEEFLSTRHYGFDNSSNVVVYDYSSALFKKFDRVSNTVSTYQSPLFEDLAIKPEGFFNGSCHRNWYVGLASMSGIIENTTPTVAEFDRDFNLIKMFGTYDPFFWEKQRSVMRNPTPRVDCNRGLIYTTHTKIPFFQIYSLEDHSLIQRVEVVPPSFKLSDKIISTVNDFAAHQKFRRDEQSTTMIISHTDQFIFSSFFNNTTEFIDTRDPKTRDYFVAVYNIEDYSFAGELAVDGAIYGTTRQGYLIEVIDDNPESFTIRLLDVGVQH